MNLKRHKVRINVADENNVTEPVLESNVQFIHSKLFNKIFKGKRKVLIIAPAESVKDVEIFENGGVKNDSTSNS